MEKINIAELLKDCPKGMELDCALYENLYFDYVREHAIYPIVCYTVDNKGEKISISFNWYGKHTPVDTAKCVIFPKGKTTWEGFVPPYKFKDGDIVFSGFNLISIFKGIKKGVSGSLHSYVSTVLSPDSNVLYINRDCWTLENIRLATEEEKEKLFKAIKDNGYKWNAETKTLERLVEPKFKVGDKVRPKNQHEVRLISEMWDNYYLFEEKNIPLPFSAQDDWELVPDGYEFFGIGDDNKIVLTKKQFLYPNTYEMCCDILDVEPYGRSAGYKSDLITAFRNLLICRDAYWKIAGEQMGLGKSWKPDFLNPTKEIRYFIFCTGISIEKGQGLFPTNKILIFPTEEMRDAFYENFKGLIEMCKELL